LEYHQSGAHQFPHRYRHKPFAAVEDMDERMFEAELHRIIGDAFLTMQRQGEAEVEFTRAPEIACKQQAKSWELRASMSLARLWRSQGKVQQAHVNCWFRFTAGSQKDSTRTI
jgi:predicted ATPase